MFSKKLQPSKKSEDIKKSAAKVLDAKKDTPTRAKHLRLFLDNAESHEILLFFENHYSHVSTNVLFENTGEPRFEFTHHHITLWN